MPSPRGASKKTSSEPYAPAARLHQVRAALDSSEGLTVYDIADRFAVSVRTAIRYLEALQNAGEPLYDERVGKRKVWRLMPSARRESISLTTSQMMSLFLSRRVFDFLAGTGFKEDLDAVFERLEATLRRKDFLAARNLDRKLFDVNEAPHMYRDRLEHVDEILTGLLKEQRLFVEHDSVSRGRRAFLLDPYTLLVYKKGLYLAGFSHQHQSIRTFALDGFRDVTWRRGETFVYPKDFHPSQIADGAFGLIRGATTFVRIFFSARVARYVERRRWHPTQKVARVAGGIELTMTVAGTTELASFVLGFGDQAEVREPPELRAAVIAELQRALGGYGARGETPAP
jgi:predicted DNA-binding transcriptional regulator YafY